MSEFLIKCLFCGRDGFTYKGLIHHACRQVGRKRVGGIYKRRFLTRAEMQKCVAAARRKPSPSFVIERVGREGEKTRYFAGGHAWTVHLEKALLYGTKEAAHAALGAKMASVREVAI
jgi:hypothetical protein